MHQIPDQLVHKSEEWIIYNLLRKDERYSIFRARKVVLEKNDPIFYSIMIVNNIIIGEYELDVLNKLKCLESDNIVKVYRYAFGPSKLEEQKSSASYSSDFQRRFESRDLYIYMEYSEDYLNLLEYIKKNGSFREDEIKKITIQLINTLAELSEKHHIVHRDINSSNILYNQKTGKIKLFGFGLSKDWCNASRFNTTVGTLLAPEVKENLGNASGGSDIWGVGLTIIHMASGDKNRVVPSDLSNECRNFIQHCLIVNPADRPKAIDLMNHEFLVDYLEIKLYDLGNGDSYNLDLLSYIKRYMPRGPSTNIKLTGFNGDQKLAEDLFNSLFKFSPITNIIFQDFKQDLNFIKSLLPTNIKLLVYQPIISSISPNNHFEINNTPTTPDTLIENIPETTTHLKVTKFDYFNQNPTIFNNIPLSTTHLILQDFNQSLASIKSLIPPTITSLSIPSFNQDIEGEDLIPSHITELILGESFQFNDYGGNLPSTIKSFTCSFNFSKPLKKNNYIPRLVSRLVLDNYNQSISKGSIPPTVYSLVLGSNYQQQDLSSLSNLPPSVFNLTLGVSKECTLDDEDIKRFIPTNVTNLTIKRQNPSQYQHNINDWSIDYHSPLGSGAFSKVYKGIKLNKVIKGQKIQNRGGKCAIKVISSNQINKNEIDTLDRLLKIQHDNIIKIYGYGYGSSKSYTEKKSLFIYMEYLDGHSTITNYLKQKQLDEKQICQLACDLVYSIAYLHQFHQIVHRDIKCDNILVDKDGSNLKLIDFGTSKHFGKSDSTNNTVDIGSQLHMAPDINESNRPSTKSDIWSIGCTIIEMAGGKLERVNGLPSIPSHLSDICRNFIQHCLITDSYSRPSAIELIHHQYFNNIELSVEKRSIKNINPVQKRKIQISNSKDIPFIERSISILELLDYNQVSYKDDFERIPSWVTSLILPSFNREFLINSIPPHIQSLSMPIFNQEILEDTIPSTITELILGESFQFNDHGGYLPDTIKSLSCSYNFSKPLKTQNNIPNGVSRLVLKNYNQPITKRSIPTTVHSLTLGSNYQQQDLSSLSNLPPSVFNLTLGLSNQCTLNDEDIKKLIPSTITNLMIKREEIKSTINQYQISKSALESASASAPTTQTPISVSMAASTSEEEEEEDLKSSLENSKVQIINLESASIPQSSPVLNNPMISTIKQNHSIPSNVEEVTLREYGDNISESINCIHM